MIKIELTNEILNVLINIEKCKDAFGMVKIPNALSNQFRKNTKKRSSYASNRIEGNPLTFEQASDVIDSENRHFLKPEQEIRNYYLALETLDQKLNNHEPFSLNLILDVQKQICYGESKNKIGLRGAMPPGVLFAVWNDDGTPAYIPPYYEEIPQLLNELIDYVNNSSDHPIVKAAVAHYQLVTIHPFEDGNGRTARILSNYILSYYGYGFKNVGSLEEYMSFDIDAYYSALQMNLPVSYYDGRDNPPHPEIWMNYFLKIFNLYSSKVLAVVNSKSKDHEAERRSHLSKKTKLFLEYLIKHHVKEFAPIELSKIMGVTNRTVIYWCTELTNNGYLKPIIINKRIRRYIVL